MKERSNNIVVTIVEGETSTRQMELDLNDYLATCWRCSAHAVGPGVFVVRFPNPRAVAQICYVGRIILQTSGDVINVTKWSSAVGSKGVMEVEWVKISNVPLDKRSERNMAYVACLAVLGDHFYDFYYEVDQILVRDPNRGDYINSSVRSRDKEKSHDIDKNLSKKLKIDEAPRGLEEKLHDNTEAVTVDADVGEYEAGNVGYRVESPDTVVGVEVIPTPPLAIEENLRVSLRNVQSKMENVQLKAVAVVKKRNIEGS
ncbi:hypothetical protein D1007_56504 [Hordeum vulgare]|nr:hypothetical protein D1007_56504 [Hordeum vulgare]